MEDSSAELLGSRSDCIDCVHQLILGASQEVYVYSQILESELYNHRPLYDHLVKLATTIRNSDIRILCHDTRRAAYNGHYFIHLCQKLPTFASIRTSIIPSHRKFRESWLMTDASGYMRIRNPQRYEGYFELDNKLECRTYRDQFLEAWEACEQDQNTRRLSL
ncbi:MAG: hypothetical protein ACI845_003169 [Gammaproteobacteria bacterium]|jgi:hypothetical protein